MLFVFPLMFIDSLTSCEDGDRKAVIGSISRFEDEYVILKTAAAEIKVKHNGLDNYQSKLVLIAGIVENDTLVEEKVYKIEEEFNLENYKRLVNSQRKFSDIF
ncbi:hypothetical protein NUSPORA_02265 [Nucleospora cyclopteri]